MCTFEHVLSPANIWVVYAARLRLFSPLRGMRVTVSGYTVLISCRCTQPAYT